MFRLRIDIVNDLNSDEIIEVSEPVSYCIVRHELPHGNPHFHAYIETELKENTLRQRIKRKFAQLTPTDYSIKKCDPNRIEEYIQYMFNEKKGNKWELIDVKGFKDDVISACISRAKAVADEYAEKKNNDKPTIYQLAEEVKQTYVKENEQKLVNITYQNQEHQDYEIYHRYLELAVRICHKYRQPFEEHYLRRLVTTAITIDSKRGAAIIIRKIMQKEFPN